MTTPKGIPMCTLDIHKALTLMNEYKPLKLETPVVPAQGTAFVTNSQGGKKKGKGKTK
jgi:hypothetical protein